MCKDRQIQTLISPESIPQIIAASRGTTAIKAEGLPPSHEQVPWRYRGHRPIFASICDLAFRRLWSMSLLPKASTLEFVLHSIPFGPCRLRVCRMQCQGECMRLATSTAPRSDQIKCLPRSEAMLTSSGSIRKPSPSIYIVQCACQFRVFLARMAPCLPEARRKVAGVHMAAEHNSQAALQESLHRVLGVAGLRPGSSATRVRKLPGWHDLRKSDA